MQVRSGHYEILASGSITAFRNEPIEFRFRDTHAPFILRFVFVADGGQPTQHVQSLSLSEVVFTLGNTDTGLTVGSAEPLELGTLMNRRFYLNYRVSSLGPQSQVTLHYTWYLGETVTDGG